jgi:hypothetical protein
MENDETQVDVTPETSNEEIELTLEEDAPEQETDWKAEALKQKAINQRLSKKIGTPEPKQELQTQKTDVPDDIKKAVEKLTLAETKRQFGYEHGLSPEETDAVFGFNPNPTKETLKNPFVEGGLAKLRSQKRVNENTPSSSSRSGKPFTIKPDATLAERQAEHERWTKNWTPKR